jgi:creatinine amidohydrolase
MNYPGTVTLKPDTYREVIVEIGESLAAHGANRLLLVNCHGGNREPLKLAGDRIQRDHGLPTYFVHWTDYAREQLQEEFGEDWGHAGDHETSVVELFHPELVKDEKKEDQTRRADFEARQYAYFDDITEQGGLGDPTNSDPEFVEQVVADATQRILDALESDLAAEDPAQ